MSTFRPFIVNLYWGGNVQYNNGFIQGDQTTRTSSIVMRQRIGYANFVDLIYNYVGVEREAFKLSLVLCYEFQGISNVTEILGDDSLETMYFLADRDHQYWGQVHVRMEAVLPPQQPGFLEMMRNFVVSQPESHNLNPSTSANPSDVACEQLIDDGEDVVNDNNGGFDNSDGSSSDGSEETRDGFSVDGSDDDDEDDDDDDDGDAGVQMQVLEGPAVVQSIPDDDENDLPFEDDDDDDDMDIWSQASNQIRLGMYFKSKEDLVNDI